MTLVALLVIAASAADAKGGQYHVYSCRMPNGQSAPVDGWSGVKSGGFVTAQNTCEIGGALIAGLGDQAVHHANVDKATWAFETRAPEMLSNAILWRAGDTAGGATVNYTYQFWMSGPTPASTFDECVAVTNCKGKGEIQQPMSLANRVVVPGPHLGAHVYLNASCSGAFEPEPYECAAGTGDANGYAAVVYLFAADLTLEQNQGPAATNVTGDLASSASVSGASGVAFTASDPGSGVYQAVFSIDGQVVQRTVINENGGRCKDVGQTTDGQPAFLYVQPCLATVSADVGFDTTKVSDGPHRLLVSVSDAAGNTAPVLDRTITVSNGGPGSGANGANGANGMSSANGANGPANGTPASAQATLTVHWKATRSNRLVSAYGRAQAIVGRLVGPGSVPIAGAQLDLTATPLYTGATSVPMVSPRTGRDGSFTVRLPAGVSSRTLRFAYRSHLGDPLPAATSALTLSVRAGIALSISPRITSVGRTIHFQGRLLGGSIPRGGKQLVLEARSRGGAWLEFHVVRAGSTGRFRASYRFRFPGPVRYQFRVLSEPEADYPFSVGSSNTVRVLER